MTELRAIAGEKDAGRKIKYFVRGDMKVSYSQFSAAKACGKIQVNGETVHADYPLKPGDAICVRLPDPEPGKIVQPEEGPVEIAYEDADLCTLNKPAPLACQCTPKQPLGTLENRMYAHYANVDGFVFRPLNRLDKGTSGLMAVAKHAHAYQILQQSLHTPRFLREYLAVVEGLLDGEGVIDLPIAKAEGATVRRCVDESNGQHAVTHYRVEGQANGRSLVRLRLETGRTHQIRVHLAALGHPICGDFLYGSELPELPGRFALHSARIALVQPLTGAPVECTSPLPAELRRLME